MRMTNRRRLVIVASGIAAAFGLGFALDHPVRARSPRKAYLSVTRASSRGDVTFITDAVRSDGSLSREILRAVDSARFRPIREVTDLQSGKLFLADPETQSYVMRTMRPETVARESTAVTSDCVSAHPGPGSASCEATQLKRFGLSLHRMIRDWNENGKAYRATALVARDLDWKAIEWIVKRDGVEVERREVTHLIRPAGRLSRDHVARRDDGVVGARARS